jgi:hypothetical protein
MIQVVSEPTDKRIVLETCRRVAGVRYGVAEQLLIPLKPGWYDGVNEQEVSFW